MMTDHTSAPDVASVTRPPRKPNFGTRGAVLAPFFWKGQNYNIDLEAGEKYETKVVGNGSSCQAGAKT